MLGRAYSMNFTNGLQRISDIVIAPGNNLLNLDLPIDPNGVVYDSIARTPIAGAILTLEQAGGGSVPSSCFEDPANGPGSRSRAVTTSSTSTSPTRPVRAAAATSSA